MVTQLSNSQKTRFFLKISAIQFQNWWMLKNKKWFFQAKSLTFILISSEILERLTLKFKNCQLIQPRHWKWSFKMRSKRIIITCSQTKGQLLLNMGFSKIHIRIILTLIQNFWSRTLNFRVIYQKSVFRNWKELISISIFFSFKVTMK